MYSIVIGLAVVVGAPAKEAPKKDAPSLVGEWAPTEAVRGGKPDMPPPGTSITFTADGKVIMREGNRDKAEEGTYKIDAKKDPAEIDISPPEKEKGPPVIGIYKFEKDTLIMCVIMGTDRPKTFESPGGSEVMLITLQRVKKD
jgi:uncharacterized protein (TIGR03067 family)